MRRTTRRRAGPFGPAAIVIVVTATLAGQQVLDRVVARVDSNIIMLSDVRAAVALGVINAPGPDADAAGTEPLIERQVILAEVARFPAPEPTDTAIDALVETMKARVGSRLPALMQATGIDEPQIRALARDTLRIQAYIKQRFGAAATLDDSEVRQWLRDARMRATVLITVGK